MKLRHIAVLSLLALFMFQGTSDSQPQPPRFTITDTARGAIRLNVHTGQSWLLETGMDGPHWVEIAERAATPPVDPPWRLREAIPQQPAPMPFPVPPQSPERPTVQPSWKVALDDEGNPIGVIVVRLPQDSKLPFEQGDIVTAVEGQPVRAPDDLRRIVRSEHYAGKRKLRVTIVRAGEEKTLEWDFQHLAGR
jgi:hypothetical protein